MATGKVSYSCIGEAYELDTVNQDILIDCAKLGGIVLLSFGIHGNRLLMSIDPQRNIQMGPGTDGLVHTCEVIEKDLEQIASMCGPTGVTGPPGEEE